MMDPERLREANEVFEDLEILFASVESQQYLLAVASLENVYAVIEELIDCFRAAEDYEKCSSLSRWREALENI